MRVLQISSAKTFSGTERHIVDLCRGMRERGHDIFVALRPTNEWQERLDFIPPENFFHASIRNSFGMFSAKRIGRFLVESDIDIIHAHLARDYIAAGIASRVSTGSRFVLTRHMMTPLKPFHKLALRNVDAAIAVSPAVASQLGSTFERKKVHVIMNGLSVDLADDADTLARQFRELHSIPLEAPLIGTLGELKPTKGQRDFVLAANEIGKIRPECRFVLAGKDNSADQQTRRELRRLVKVFGLDERFLWLDWLDDTAPFFAAIDLFVSPSHTESFGLAILEAMERGKAVVATETDGAKELLHGLGSLTPIGAPVEMAAAINALIADDRRRSAMGASLRDSAFRRFSFEQMADATEALYRRVIANG